MKEDKLKGRKHELMIAVVEDYINDASPITSGGVHKNHLTSVSTATLRNELSALEAMGLLKQLHTSGGRVPTVLGYKYYVNHLLQGLTLNYDQLDGVKSLLDERSKSLSEIVSGVAKIINRAVKYPTVIYVNGYDKLVVENIKIIPLVGDSALALIQTSSGYLTNTLDAKASSEAYEDASKYLTKKFAGKTLGEMMHDMEKLENDMLEEISGFKEILDTLIEGIKKFVEENHLNIRQDKAIDVLDDSADDEQTKKMMKLLGDQEELERALETSGGELSVEMVDDDEEYSGLAVIKAPLCIDGTPVASIGVFGPQRMDYKGIASALKVITSQLKGENDET
mgnify:FL=1